MLKASHDVLVKVVESAEVIQVKDTRELEAQDKAAEKALGSSSGDLGASATLASARPKMSSRRMSITISRDESAVITTPDGTGGGVMEIGRRRSRSGSKGSLEMSGGSSIEGTLGRRLSGSSHLVRHRSQTCMKKDETVEVGGGAHDANHGRRRHGP